MNDRKSSIDGSANLTLAKIGRSYYAFCLETALDNIKQARDLMSDDVIDDNHELPLIERKITEALEAT